MKKCFLEDTLHLEKIKNELKHIILTIEIIIINNLFFTQRTDTERHPTYKLKKGVIQLVLIVFTPTDANIHIPNIIKLKPNNHT